MHSKNIIWGIALAVSLFLVGNMGWSISDRLDEKIICAFIFVAVDAFSQFALTEAKFYWSLRKFRAWLYFAVVAVYVTFFSIPSAIGYFNAKLSRTDYQQTQFIHIQDNKNSRLDQLRIRIPFLYTMLSNESRTGYGWKSQDIALSIDNAEKEERELMKVQTNQVPQVNLTKNFFEILAKSLPWKPSPESIRVFMFAIAMIVIQFALIVTNPEKKVTEKTRQEIKDPVPMPENITNREFIQRNRGEFIRFVNALIDPRLKRLSGDPVIHKATGISLKMCDQIRQILRVIKADGKPLIELSAGCNKANFSKEKMIEIIKII